MLGCAVAQIEKRGFWHSKAQLVLQTKLLVLTDGVVYSTLPSCTHGKLVAKVEPAAAAALLSLPTSLPTAWHIQPCQSCCCSCLIDKNISQLPN